MPTETLPARTGLSMPESKPSDEGNIQASTRASSRAEIRMGRSATESHLIWVTTIFMVIFHVGFIAALFFFTWTNLIAAIVLYFFAINVGIGMGYHRLLVHRGYQVPKFIEYFMAVCGTLSLEGGPIAWVAIHRIHHQHSDKEGDPHSPQEGTFWSHVGWVIFGHALNAETTTLAHYAPDLAKDRFHLWLSKYHWVPLTVLGLSLLVFGSLAGGLRTGIGLFLWGIFLRVTLGLHATWLVNSATHMIGGRRFETRDDSRNSWWVALVTGGEGWHNNHHAYPVSARHGLAWYEFDPNYYGIWLLKKLGLARNVQIAKFTRRDPEATGPRATYMTTV